jgi:hypothetical protein
LPGAGIEFHALLPKAIVKSDREIYEDLQAKLDQIQVQAQ